MHQLIRSWACKDGNVHDTAEILSWIDGLNRTIEVKLEKVGLDACTNWYYNEHSGQIMHKNNIFFQISGMEQTDGGIVTVRQPIIYQFGIGYLGIIAKEIDGQLNFLMQAKIEPGNVNRIQISPTLQATLSNFTQQHGGEKPKYLDYFVNAKQHRVLVDQVQSEQSSRFYKKRNRNIIIQVEEEVEVLPMFRWMTIGQIKALMRLDNIVNMDTRTVLSCIPYFQEDVDCAQYFADPAMYRSMFNSQPFHFSSVYGYLNDYKMYHLIESHPVPLYALPDWEMRGNEFVCKHPNNFKIVFCDISIEGREVKHWTQPLVEAIGQATFGLVTCVQDGVRKFLVKARHEVGIQDWIELGPTVQHEPICGNVEDAVSTMFFDCLTSGTGVLFDALLSEEGGRFYQEQNRNVILEMDALQLKSLPDGYFLLDYKTLNLLVQFNNCLNIQLRNLLSLLEVTHDRTN